LHEVADFVGVDGNNRERSDPPQGGVVSPLLSNILLTPFDKEMRHKGYQLTRWADDWVVICRTLAEAQSALAQATKILEKLGVTLNREKTRIEFVMPGGRAKLEGKQFSPRPATGRE
jgi:retron-type reverse transcriptase